MGKGKITVKELASILGVSISTVSKSLSDSYEISEKTKLRVRKLAKKYNYKPNRIAVNLKSGKTRTIGVVLPSILNNFFTRVLYGIERIASQENYNIITCISYESYEKEVSNMQILSNGSIDGLIVALAEGSQIKGDFDHFKESIEEGNPVVMFDRVTDLVDCDKVVVDDYNNAFFATKHLIDIGCKRIALISTIDFLGVGQLRVDGFKKAIMESFRELDQDLIITTNTENLEYELEKLLANKKIDGVFAIDEDSALAVVKTVNSKGYHIPNDISIIGYACAKIANNLTPTLTTVNQHGITIGKSAAKTLINRLNNSDKEYKIKIIEVDIDQRESTMKRKKIL